jgi:lambda family phage tail tape measure protein
MASNIRVVLELDNKRYLADVKRADDATTKFAQNTEKSLGGIAPKITALNNQFANLAAGIAALGIGAAISNAIRFADSIQDISDATGIAVSNVLGFSNAVALNGGTADGAQKAILRLATTIDEAASGSKSAQMAFINVGIGLRDLERLSEQDILAKTIQGLAKIQDSSKRVALAQQLLGKEFRSVNLQGVADGLSSANAEAAKYSETIRKTADMQNKLDIAFQKVQLAVLKAIEPIAEFINKLDDRQIEAIVNTIVDLGKALAVLAAVGPLLRGLITVLTGLAGSFALAKLAGTDMGAAFKGIGTAFGSLGKTADIAYSYIDRFRRGTPMFSKDLPLTERLGTLFGKLGERGQYLSGALGGIAGAVGGIFGAFVRLIPIIGQAIAAFYLIDGALQVLTGRDVKGWINEMASGLEDFVRSKAPALANALDKLGEKLGMAPSPSAQRANEAEIKRLQEKAKAIKEAEDARKREQERLRQVQTDLDKFKNTQQEIVDKYDDANRSIIQRIAFETSLIGKTEQEVEVLRAQEEVLNRQRGIIQDLQREQGRLRLELDTDPTAAAKIEAINVTIRRLWGETATAQEIIGNYTKKQQEASAAERIRISTLTQINELENLRATLLGYSITEQEKFNQSLRGEEFKNRTQAEIDQLRQQAIERDRLTSTLNVEKTARETGTRLIELETNLLGVQFSELQKLEQLKAANPEAFARKTETEIAALQQQAAALDEAAAKFRALAFARDLQRQGEDFAAGVRDQLNLDRAVGESARRRINVEIEGRNQLQSKLREIADRYGDEKKLSDELRQARQKEIDDATNGINNLIALKKKSVEEDQALRDSFEFGWENAFNKYAEDADNAARQAQGYFETFTRGFEDAFVRFVQTGKFSFKDLINSMIAQFARLQAQKFITSIFGGGGGGGGFFGNLFGSIGKIFGFANGGNPAMNKPIVVGERGPELMIPRNASTIIPNEALGGGGNQTIVSYNIQAVDAASFQQLVARDPKFLHAVVEKGRRSMPQGARR